MSGPTRIRVRARRSRAGSVFEWHPADEEAAKDRFERPHFVIALLYRAVDRTRVSDCDIVATFEVLPSGRVDSLEVKETRDSLSLDQLSSLRDDIVASAQGGERAHA